MESKRITKPGAKMITIFAGDLIGKGNYQDFGRYEEVDLAIAADAQATLPSLIEAMKQADYRRSQGRHCTARRQTG